MGIMAAVGGMAEKVQLENNMQVILEIIESLPDATLMIDREGKVIAWNRAIEKLSLIHI